MPVNLSDSPVRSNGAPPAALARKKLSEMVAERIRDLIMEQRLGPGDRLPTEQALADRFGVSRISVREATQALSFLGIIEASPRRGLKVGRLDMSRVSRYLGFFLAISDYPREQLLETRLVIELGALPHVMAHIAREPQVYDHLQSLADEVRSARDLDDRIAADVAFHRALLDASGIQPMLAFHDLLQVFFDRFRRSLAHGDWRMGIRSHQKIIDALRNGDLPAAERELRSHLETHRRYKDPCA
jgi:GntR family transcriptional regulator, transcriptional repressor for pyruvate dehydrogenase complex